MFVAIAVAVAVAIANVAIAIANIDFFSFGACRKLYLHEHARAQQNNLEV